MDSLRKLRKQKGYSQADIADALGIAQNSYSRYENGQRQPDIDMLQKLSKIFGVTVDDLLKDTEPIAFGKQIKIEPELVAEDEILIPVVASLRCGFGRSGEATFRDRKPVPKSYVKRWGKDIVYYEAVGESMMPTITPGDLLITVPGSVWEDGWVVVVDVNDSDTVKRIYRADDGGINLVPDNPKQYTTMHLTKEDLKTYNVAILGHVVKAISPDL